MENIIMGLDIGTSGIRAELFDENGFEVCGAHEEYSLLYSEKYAELDPETVFAAFIRVARKAMDKLADKSEAKLCGMGISCQMHSLILADKHGEALTNVITWADTRATEQAKRLAEQIDVTALYQRTGCIVNHAMYPLAKIMWFRDNEPELFKKADKFLSLKEFILYRLYGEYVVDYTIASSQGYYDIHQQSWCEDVMSDILGVSKDRFSTAVPCTYALRNMKSEYANQMGISAETPMVLGSGDGIMANIGCGVTDETKYSSTIGTSGAVRTAANKPLVDDQLRTWCYSFTEDTWVAGGAINNGGLVLKWLRQNMGSKILEDANKMLETGGYSIRGGRCFEVGDEYAAMDFLAESVPVGSSGLICLPYLTGERSPDWNADVRGMVGGMSLHHGNAHFARASMEGILFRLYSVYEVLSGMCAGQHELLATGGYISSKFWLQMQADVFNRSICVSAVKQAAALGAAFTAMAGVGMVDDLKKPLLSMKPIEKFDPNPEQHALYMKVYKSAMDYYERVKDWKF